MNNENEQKSYEESLGMSESDAETHRHEVGKSAEARAQEKHVLQDLLEGEWDVRSYSGRGMFGAKCLGVVMGGPMGLGRLVASVLENVQRLEDRHEGAAEQIARAFRGMRTDQMGLGSIVYFPDVKFVDEEY